ncbi:MAG: FcoT family thioesterase [Cyanobacteriota bacterium]|nr:FcoT family thioesterase [Cyanobacteriota bacterium]
MNTNDFLKLTLDIYEEECRYLKELKIDIDKKESVGHFSVPSTCYAVKGRKYHLNAAEVIIIYEQIMYATLSTFFINGLHHLKPVTVDYFFPTIVDEKTLIAKFNTRFSRQVDSHAFSGIFSVQKITSRQNKYFFHTGFDIEGGAQVADVTICIEL